RVIVQDVGRPELGDERLVADAERRFERFDGPKAPTARVGFPRNEDVGEEAQLFESFGVERGIFELKLRQRAAEERSAGGGDERSHGLRRRARHLSEQLAEACYARLCLCCSRTSGT